MLIEVKQPKKGECSCGHPLTKEAARKKHEEENEHNKQAYLNKQIEQLSERLHAVTFDIERLEGKSHRHWWQ